MNAGIEERLPAMIRDTLVWDNQACMPFRTDPEFLPQLARLRATGYDIVCLSVGFDLMDQAANIRVLASFRAWVADPWPDTKACWACASTCRGWARSTVRSR